jgi:glycosyltransferase involved in cell wall biosynthesis
MSFGYIHPHKNFELYLDALKELTEPTTAVLAGEVRRRHGMFRPLGWTDERYSRRLDRRAASLAPHVKVLRVGFLPDEELHGLLQSADVVVIPYRATSQSAVAAEVLGNGCAVVATDLDGLKALLHDAALYAPLGRPADMAKQIRRLQENTAEREVRRNLARQWAVRESLRATALAMLPS